MTGSDKPCHPTVWAPERLSALVSLQLERSEVGYVFVTLSDKPRRGDESLLDADERDRAARFVREVDRHRFTHAHIALRWLLARCLDVPPSDVAYRVGPNGKPRVAEPLAHIEFNMAHSGDLALIAVSREVPVGVDVERLREVPEADDIISSSFSEAEQQAIRALPLSERPTAFVLHWARKEAVVKATGEGLSRPLESFEIDASVDATKPIGRTVSAPGMLDAVVFDLPSPPGFAAAGAVVGRSLLQTRWRPLQPAP